MISERNRRPTVVSCEALAIKIQVSHVYHVQGLQKRSERQIYNRVQGLQKRSKCHIYILCRVCRKDPSVTIITCAGFAEKIQVSHFYLVQGLQKRFKCHIYILCRVCCWTSKLQHFCNNEQTRRLI